MADQFLKRDTGTGLWRVEEGAAVRTAVRALTNDEIKALPTTPISLVSAPGSGLRIRPYAATFSMNNSSGAWTNINATYATLQLQWPGGLWACSPIVNDSGASVTDLTSFLNTVQRAFWDFAVPVIFTQGGWATGPVTQGSGDAENAALELALDNNGSGALTGGHSANTGRVTVYYTIDVLA